MLDLSFNSGKVSEQNSCFHPIQGRAMFNTLKACGERKQPVWQWVLCSAITVENWIKIFTWPWVCPGDPVYLPTLYPSYMGEGLCPAIFQKSWEIKIVTTITIIFCNIFRPLIPATITSISVQQCFSHLKKEEMEEEIYTGNNLFLTHNMLPKHN